MSPNPFSITLDAIEKENAVLQQVKAAIDEVIGLEALVGIPEDKNEQHKADGLAAITNAELLFIHTNGSPANNIPPRDVLDSSLMHNKEEVSEQMQKVLDRCLEGNSAGAVNELKKTGILAENKAKGWFDDPANGWDPNDPATIKAKSKKGKGQKDKPLIDTGELRKAITSTVRKRGETK